jgi:hypothetical protein
MVKYLENMEATAWAVLIHLLAWVVMVKKSYLLLSLLLLFRSQWVLEVEAVVEVAAMAPVLVAPGKPEAEQTEVMVELEETLLPPYRGELEAVVEEERQA